MCALHGPCGQIPVSPDLLAQGSEEEHSNGRGIFEYLVGVPTDPWINCFVTESFASRHKLDIRKGWEKEGNEAPIWFSELTFMCTKSLLHN